MIWFFQKTSPVVVLATLLVSGYLYVTEESLITEVGGFTLHVTDLLFVLAAMYCLAGALVRWHSSLEIVLLMLSAMLLLSFGRGIVTWGSGPAGVQFRQVAVFIALATFVYFWGRGLKIDWVFKAVVVLGWGIVALSIARLVLGLDAFILQERDPSYEFRTLNSESALMLGEAALIALNSALSASRRTPRLAYTASFVVFAVAVFVSNQRTSAFAMLAGVGMIIAFLPRRYRTIVFGAGSLALTVAAMILGVMWIELGNDIVDYLPRAVSMIVLGEETYGAREVIWASYLDAYAQWPLIDQLLGQPFGGTQLAISQTSDSYVMLSPHNGYIALLINIGALGVLLFAAVLILALVKGVFLLTREKRLDPSPNLRWAVAVVASHAVYSYGYLLSNDQGLLLALALQIIATPSRVSSEVQLVQPNRLVSGTGRRIRYQG